MICSFNFLIILAVCLNISTVINIKILTNSNQQTQSYKFTNHIATFLSVVLITEMLKICIQTSCNQNAQLILKSYLPVVYGITSRSWILNFIIWIKRCYPLSFEYVVHVCACNLWNKLFQLYIGTIIMCTILHKKYCWCLFKTITM